MLDSGNHLRISHQIPETHIRQYKNQIMLLFPKLTKQQEKMVLEQKLTEQMNQEPPKKYALPDIGAWAHLRRGLLSLLTIPSPSH